MGVQRAHAFDDELAAFDAVATADALAAGALSPVEVAEAAARRAELVEPEINAIVVTDHDRAVAAARDLHHRGGLAGVPTYIKDQVDVAGLPTTWGSEALHGGPAKRRSAGMAAQFEAMHLVVMGKSTMPEFGFTPATEPTHRPSTRNPWNLERGVGGSSGGAAALVAAGVVPVAHAVDGGGSIRIPANCCGLVGLKPSRGRLLPHREEQILPLAVSVDGVVSRTVRDTARFMAMAEEQWRNRRLAPTGEVARPLQRRLRIGAFIDVPIDAPTDEPTRATFDDTVALLESLGHHVEPMAAPIGAQFRDDFVTYWQFLSFLVTSTAKVLHGRHVRSDRYLDFTTGLAAGFRRDPSRLFAAARRLRGTAATMDEVHRRYDVVLSPVSATIATPLGHLHNSLPYDEMLERVARWIPYTPLANAAGTPAISLPLGYESGTGLPVGMMFGAARGADALLLELALELEAARPFRRLDEVAALEA